MGASLTGLGELAEVALRALSSLARRDSDRVGGRTSPHPKHWFLWLLLVS